MARSRTKSRNKKQSRRRKSGFANFLRAIILEGTGVLALLVLYFLVRFDPSDRPDWLFGLVNEKANQVDMRFDQDEGSRAQKQLQIPLAAGLSKLLPVTATVSDSNLNHFRTASNTGYAAYTGAAYKPQIEHAVENQRAGIHSSTDYQSAYNPVQRVPSHQLQEVFR